MVNNLSYEVADLSALKSPDDSDDWASVIAQMIAVDFKCRKATYEALYNKAPDLPDLRNNPDLIQVRGRPARRVSSSCPLYIGSTPDVRPSTDRRGDSRGDR